MKTKSSKKFLAIILSVLMVMFSFPLSGMAATALTYEQNTVEDVYSASIYNSDDFITYAYEGIGTDGTLTVSPYTDITVVMDAGYFTSSTYSDAGSSIGWHYGSYQASGGFRYHYCVTTDAVFTMSNDDYSFSTSGFGGNANANGTYAPNSSGSSDSSITTTFTLEGGLPAGTYTFTVDAHFQMKRNYSSGSYSTQKEATVSDTITIVVQDCEESGGSHDYVLTDSVAASCTEQAYDKYECSICGKVYEEYGEEATGHDYVGVYTEPTCTDDGYTTYTCSKCDDVYTETDEGTATGHNYVTTHYDPDCGNGGYDLHVCENCGDEYIDNVTEATGDHSGDDNGFCEVCGQPMQPEQNSEGVYEIYKTGHLYWIAQQAISGNSYDAILMADISITETGNHVYYPMGSSTYPYSGDFNGNGHTITNGDTETPVVNTLSSVCGIFAYTDGANIYDLTVAGNLNIQEDATNVGAVIGFANDTTVTNVVSTVNITNTDGVTVSNIGGIIGEVDGSTTISNSSFEGTITISNPDSAQAVSVGGFVGSASQSECTLVRQSRTIGTITVDSEGTQYVGGFFGNANQGSASLSVIVAGNSTSMGAIKNSYSTATVTGSTMNYVGTVVGRISTNWGATGSSTNYYLEGDTPAFGASNTITIDTKFTESTADEFASGAVTYGLNSDGADEYFYQNIDVEEPYDEIPLLDGDDSIIVYAYQFCDGENHYTNDAEYAAEDHSQHYWTAEDFVERVSTCTESYDTYTCEQCGQTVIDEDSYAEGAGHDYQWTELSSSTVSSIVSSLGSTLNSWFGTSIDLTSVTSYHEVVCSVCGDALTSTLGVHSYDEYGFCTETYTRDDGEVITCLAFETPGTTTIDSDTFYEIENAGELFWFSKYVADNELGFLDSITDILNQLGDTNYLLGSGGACAELLCDIVVPDYAQDLFVPIGTADNPYAGIFNGNGYTVNLGDVTVNQDGYGLFGYTQCAHITDVRVEGTFNIDADHAYIGGIVGYASSTVSNNIVSVLVSEVTDEDGILSKLGIDTDTLLSIFGVDSLSDILSMDLSNFDISTLLEMIDMSALIEALTSNALSLDDVTDFISEIEVYVDGTLIENSSSGVTIKNNDGTTVKHVGGIIGSTADSQDDTVYLNNSRIDKCYFDGDIEIVDSTDCVGGLVGYAYTMGSHPLINHSMNLGTVHTTADAAITGGLLGYVSSPLFSGVQNSYGWGDVYNDCNVAGTSTADYTGTLFGKVVFYGFTNSSTGSFQFSISNVYYVSDNDTTLGTRTSYDPSGGTGELINQSVNGAIAYAGANISNALLNYVAKARSLTSFANGKVAYELNDGTIDGTQYFYQNLDPGLSTDTYLVDDYDYYPVFEETDSLGEDNTVYRYSVECTGAANQDLEEDEDEVAAGYYYTNDATLSGTTVEHAYIYTPSIINNRHTVSCAYGDYTNYIPQSCTASEEVYPNYDADTNDGVYTHSHYCEYCGRYMTNTGEECNLEMISYSGGVATYECTECGGVYDIEYDVIVTVVESDLGTVDVLSYGENTVGYGETYMATAEPNEGVEFLGWSINGKIVSTESTLEEVAYSDITIEPLFREIATETEITLTYLDEYGNIISQVTGTPSDLAAAVQPTAPAIAGYTFTGWDVSTEDIAELTESTSICAVYEKDADTYTVTTDATLVLPSGIENGAIPFDTTVTVKDADASAWTIDGVVVAYGTSYTFIVCGDVEVQPSYDSVVVQSTVTILGASLASGSTYKVSFSASRNVSDDDTLISSGFVYGKNLTSDELDLDYVGMTGSSANAGAVKAAYASITGSDQFILNYGISSRVGTACARAFVTVKHSDGTTETYYSDALFYTYE